MFSPCSQGVSSTKNPNRKNMQNNRTILSVPDRDGRFTWSPGAEKLPTDPGGSWRKDVPGWEKSRARMQGLRVRVRVCVMGQGAETSDLSDKQRCPGWNKWWPVGLRCSLVDGIDPLKQWGPPHTLINNPAPIS